MSFWDTLKPAVKPPSLTQVSPSEDQKSLWVEFDDGHSGKLSAQLLRQSCPCAECVDEWTHQVRVRPDQVPESLQITRTAPVGNYALSLTFSDNHQTGIFHWPLLRQLSEKK